MKNVTKDYIKVGERCVLEYENGFTNLTCTAANVGKINCIPSCRECYFFESDIDCLDYDSISCTSTEREDEKYVIFVKNE